MAYCGKGPSKLNISVNSKLNKKKTVLYTKGMNQGKRTKWILLMKKTYDFFKSHALSLLPNIEDFNMEQSSGCFVD